MGKYKLTWRDVKFEDFKTIRKIFRGFKYKKPDKSTLVIHLRLGDTVSNVYGDEYSYSIDYYRQLFNKIKRNKKIKKIDIVTGLHRNVYIKKSNKILNQIISIFRETYPVNVLITKNPDKDFYYMCHSKFFANSGGGFSLLITNFLKQDKTNKIYENV